MQTAKMLAEAVIPNEYGINPEQKLRIGSKICNALLGKLLADLGNMRDESLATAVSPWPHDLLLDHSSSRRALHPWPACMHAPPSMHLLLCYPIGSTAGPQCIVR